MTFPNDRAVIRKDEWAYEQEIKSQQSGFFDGSFVVRVTVTAQKSDAVGSVGLAQYRAVGIHQYHWAEIRTLLPESFDLLASELDSFRNGPYFSLPILEAAPIYSKLLCSLELVEPMLFPPLF
jgi:hypothetical protein